MLTATPSRALQLSTPLICVFTCVFRRIRIDPAIKQLSVKESYVGYEKVRCSTPKLGVIDLVLLLFWHSQDHGGTLGVCVCSLNSAS
jgi:hypothetical protein